MLRASLLVWASATLSAQSVLYSHALGNPTGDIATGGDLDGDGVRDYALRVAGTTPGVTVISGRSGKNLRVIRAGAANDLGRFMTIIRDVDADGADDLLLGAPLDATRGAGAGAVHLLSGRSLRRLASFFGKGPGDGLARCAAMPDIDNDGTTDYAIAAPFADFPANDSGVAYLISGRTHSVLRSHVGAGGQALGELMLGIGDQDADGRDDYLLSNRAIGGSHALDVYSGRTGLRLFTVTPGSGAIASLSLVGDVNNDGRDDIGVGLPSDGASGRILVLSGQGFSVLLSRSGSAGNEIGRTLTGIGDITGDRRADLAIVRNGLSSPAIVTISGATGTDIAELARIPIGSPAATSLQAIGDVNGDARIDLAVAPFQSTTAVALATRAMPLTSNNQLTSLLSAGQGLGINFGSAAAGDSYLVLASFSGTSPGTQIGGVTLPLNFDAMTQFSANSANRYPYVNSLGVLDANGFAGVQFGPNLRVPPELNGVTMHHAVLTFRGTQARAVSNAVPLTFIDQQVPARPIEETFAANTNMDRARSGGLTFGTLGVVGGTGVHGDFDHRLGTDRGNGVFEFDLQRDTRNGVQGFAVPASHTLTGAEEFITDGTFQFATLEVPAGIRVRFVGTTPLRLLVRGQINILGTLDASGADVPQYSASIPGLGQAGGQPGPGGGRGGKGADTHGGTGAPVHGENGQDVRVAASHAYAGTAAGTGGRGALQFPAGGNTAVTHTLSNLCMQVPAGGGGGGFLAAGQPGVAVRTPSNQAIDLGANNAGGTAFQMLPVPANAVSSVHFMVGGSGGGGGGSHSFFHQLTRPFIWKSGMAGSGGGGAMLLRAGAEIQSAASGALLSRGGALFDRYENLIQGPPGAGGGGSGGSILLQSPLSIRLQGPLDVRGAVGAQVRPGLTQLLNFDMRGGDGAAGFYRVEAPTTLVANPNPPIGQGNVANSMTEVDAQAGQQSLFYDSGAPFAARFVRFEIDALVNGAPVRFGDVAGASARFGDPTAPLWFKLQGAQLDGNGQAVAGTERPWRDNTAQLTSDVVNGFRFVLVRNSPNLTVSAVRVYVAD